MDNNDIFSSSSTLVRDQNSPFVIYFPTLSDWQQTGYDLNSISADPLFTDSLLHVPPYSPVCGKGIFLSEVTEDIEGNLRKNPPTIGAYEIDSCEVGISENLNTADQWFSLYPNPANSELNILINTGKLQGKVEIEIFNINGQKVAARNFLITNPTHFFDISFLVGGIYYCTAKSRNLFTAKRFVVVK